MRLSRKLRERFYYSIPVAGAQAGYSRSESYRAANRGDIPTERDGKFRLVPRRVWDAKVRRLRRGPRAKSRRSQKPAPAEAGAT
jgi:hypothetical protein